MRKTSVQLIALLITISLIAGLSFITSGCKKISKADGVAATVNGEKITIKDLDEEHKRISSRTASTPKGPMQEEQENRIKKQLLFKEMETVLILQETKKNNIKVSDKDVQNRYKQFQGGLNDKDFKKRLKESGYTEKSLKDQIKTQLLTEELIKKKAKAKKVTDKDIKEYYDKNKEQFKDPDKKTKSFKEVKSQIKQMLESQAQQEARTNYLDEIKREADVRLYFW